MKESSIIQKTKKIKTLILSNTISMTILTVLLLITLSGCKKIELTEEEMLSIKYGITEKEVKTKLGEPKNILTNSDKVNKMEHEFSEKSSDRLIWEDPDIFIKFLDGKQELKNIDGEIENSTTLLAYQYSYINEFGEDATWTIYFDENKVVWMSFP